MTNNALGNAGEIIPASVGNVDSILSSDKSSSKNKVKTIRGSDKVTEEGKKDAQSNESGSSEWEAEGNSEGLFVGRCVLPTLVSARPPIIKWSEDLHYVRIKFMITDVNHYFLQWDCRSIQFR